MLSRKITIGLILTALFLFVSYIYFTSSLSALGYELERQESKLSDVAEKENELFVTLAGRKTPDYLLAQSRQAGLVEIGTFGAFLDARGAALGQAR